jgi:hypothetical protein
MRSKPRLACAEAVRGGCDSCARADSESKQTVETKNRRINRLKNAHKNKKKI